MDALNKISPELAKISKEIPFRIPENYFEEFPDRLQGRIRAREKTGVDEKRMMAFKPYLAAAVLIIVALISGTLIFRNIAQKRSLQNLHAEISQTVERELYYISEETILRVMNYTTGQEAVTISNHTEEIIDYLMNEDIPLNEIIDAF
ncbi:MAG: hypothetical protein JXB19_10075 [Bacteroidales bacterium]|nr:hypothetical protein [Bacteroidales bacterium]